MAGGFPDLVAVPIDDVDRPALLALVWRPRPSPVLAALLPHCRESFEPAPAGYPQAAKSA
jgi:hypothetical protein